MNALTPTTANAPLMLAVQPSQALALVTTAVPAVPQRQVRTIALEDIVRCIMARWKSALFAALLTSSCVFLLMTGQVPQYAAEASIVMRINDDKGISLDGATAPAESYSAPFLLNNHRVQLKSRRFLEYFFTSLTPEERAVFLAPPARVPTAARIMESLRSAPPPSALSQEEQDRENFIASLEPSTVDFIKESYILRITARHHDPDTAARLANSWVRAYIDYVGREDSSTSLHATTFLRQQAEEFRKRVDESERKLNAYRTEKGLLDTAAEAPADNEKLKMLSTELAKAELDLSRVQESLRQIEACGGDLEKLMGVEALAQSPAVSALRPEITAKLQRKEFIDQEYGPKHPEYLNFYREFAVLRESVSQSIRRAVSEIQNKSRSLESSAANVKKQLAAATSAMLARGKDAGQFNMLKDQLEADRSAYSKVLARLNESSVRSAFPEVTQLRPSEKAVAPEKPSSPSKPMSVILAGFSFVSVFVALPLLLAFAGALRKNGLSAVFGEKPAAEGNPAAASAGTALSTPASAAFPPVPPSAGSSPAHPPAIGSMEVLGAIPSLTPPAEGRLDQMLASLFRSSSPARTAFETAAARLAACAVPGKNVILVSSRTAGEGKSFCAAAIGVACIAQGKSALIIDANLRRPTLPAWLPRQPGGASIWDIVASDGRLHLDIQQLRCGASNLFTLQAGGASTAPAVAFSKPWFPGLMKFLTDRVDVVILDAPSLDENPEISLLAAAAHQAVIVCNKNLSDSNAMLEAASRLKASLPELTMAGCLLNDGPLPTGTVLA